MGAGSLAVASSAIGAPLNTNLVINPSFESVDTTVGGAFGSVLINQWQGSGFAYAYTQNYDNGGPLADGGDYYIQWWTTATVGIRSSRTSTCRTGESAAAIADGTAAYDLSAYFSSYLEQGDFGNLTARFLDSGGVELESVTVTESDTTQWTFESTSGFVPAGTTLVRIESQGTALAAHLMAMSIWSTSLFSGARPRISSGSM